VSGRIGGVVRRLWKCPDDLAPLRGCPRRRGWHRLSRGLYLPAAVAANTLVQLQAWNLVLPEHSAFSHLTAAELGGWWLPAEVAHPVFAALWDSPTFPQRRGLRVTRHAGPLPVEIAHGVRVTAAAETMLALARDLALLDHHRAE